MYSRSGEWRESSFILSVVNLTHSKHATTVCFCCASLSTLDSGREIPAICNCTGVWHFVFVSRVLVTGSGPIAGCSFMLSVGAAGLWLTQAAIDQVLASPGRETSK